MKIQKELKATKEVNTWENRNEYSMWKQKNALKDIQKYKIIMSKNKMIKTGVRGTLMAEWSKLLFLLEYCKSRVHIIISGVNNTRMCN